MKFLPDDFEFLPNLFVTIFAINSFPLPGGFADVIVRKIASGEELEPKQVIEIFGKSDKYI